MNINEITFEEIFEYISNPANYAQKKTRTQILAENERQERFLETDPFAIFDD